MKPYQLTFKDKLYFFFESRYHKRYYYLYPKVEQHQLKWFNENNIRIPLNFKGYIKTYTECLLNELGE